MWRYYGTRRLDHSRVTGERPQDTVCRLAHSSKSICNIIYECGLPSSLFSHGFTYKAKVINLFFNVKLFCNQYNYFFKLE